MSKTLLRHTLIKKILPTFVSNMHRLHGYTKIHLPYDRGHVCPSKVPDISNYVS
jgi:hypothetical protein